MLRAAARAARAIERVDPSARSASRPRPAWHAGTSGRFDLGGRAVVTDGVMLAETGIATRPDRREIRAGGRCASITRCALASSRSARRRDRRAPARRADLVGVLADRDVQGPGDAGQMHVDLHLRPVLRLGERDAVALRARAKHLAECVLNSTTCQVFGASRSPSATASSEPPKWPPMRLDPPLPAGLGIEVEHGGAGARAGCGPAAPPPAGRSRTGAGCARETAARVTQRKSYQSARSHSLPISEAPR